MTPKVNIKDINTFLAGAFNGDPGDTPEITLLEPGRVTMRMAAKDKHLRPGGIISGPTQMTLADHAAYIAIFTELGITPMAVTSNLSINFLSACKGNAVIAEAKTLKLGRSLAVIEVSLKAEGSDKTASHAVVTYAIPKS